MPTLALVCATRDRPAHVLRRIPIWCRSGMDAVIIVDATMDHSSAREIEKTCHESGATYVRFPPTLRDTRAAQRNLGVRLSRTEWVLIQDDDDSILVEFDHDVFDKSADGVDYLWAGHGSHILYHRRENYLRLGGYPEDMVNAEDMVFSQLVRAKSRSNLEGPVYRRVIPAKEDWELKRAATRRVANMFWYPFTLVRFLERSPKEQKVHIYFSAILMPFRSVRRLLHPIAFLVVIPVYSFGLATGFGWHYIRKALDKDFRRSLRFYREALSKRSV